MSNIACERQIESNKMEKRMDRTKQTVSPLLLSRLENKRSPSGLALEQADLPEKNLSSWNILDRKKLESAGNSGKSPLIEALSTKELKADNDMDTVMIMSSSKRPLRTKSAVAKRTFRKTKRNNASTSQNGQTTYYSKDSYSVEDHSSRHLHSQSPA